MLKFLLKLSLVVVLIATGFLGWAWQGVPQYPDHQSAEYSCNNEAPADEDSLTDFKVLSFNVQYMASKNYVFFYDMDGATDSQPSMEHVQLTLDRVADIIRDEDPDVVLIQEINDATDSRTHNYDQITALQQRLEKEAFPCESSAYYWKADYVPHPKIAGSVGMKLLTLSRHPIVQSDRYQLPLMPMDPVSQRFYFQRALLETHLQVGEQVVAVLNTHYDAWGEGTDVMRGQVAATQKRLEALDAAGIPWVLGGDFNLLPPDGDRQRPRIEQAGTGIYDKDTAIAPLYQNYGAIPSLENLNSAEEARWYTHLSNDPRVTAPDRTIDYLFYSNQWQLQNSYIRQRDTLDISDHLPVVGVFALSLP